jgi:hypothetical protein
MSWDAIGAIGELASALVVLITLVYLAVQVKESNKLARSSSLLAVLDGFSSNDISQSFQHPELLDISIRGYQDWDSLPLADKSRFDGLMTQKLLHMQKIIVHHENGLIDEGNYNAWLAHTAAMMKTPGGQQWMTHARRIMAPDIISEVDQYIANNPDSPSFMETYAYMFESGE